MSDITKELAAAALTGKDSKKNESKPLILPDVVYRRNRIFYDDFEPYDTSCFVPFPPSVTDQTHGLRISEQVKIGQAVVRDDQQQDEFDFKPGEKDDGREALGMIEWMEPAELSERENANNEEIRRQVEFQIEARKRAEKENSTKDTSDSSKDAQKSDMSVSDEK